MLSNLLDELKSTTKNDGKDAILKKHDSDFLKYLLHAAYNPYIVYHVKLKKSEIPEPGVRDIIDLDQEIKDLLDFCSESMSPKQNREKVINILSELTLGSQDLLLGVLNKNLKVGIAEKKILKIFPGLFPVFEVQLANTYNRTKQYNINEWIASNKLDGIRGIALRLNNKWIFRTRQGKEILTVNHLKPMLENLYNSLGYTFWDGELYKSGLPFEKIQGAVMGFTKGTAYDIDYHVFCCGYADDFLKQESNNIISAHNLTSYINEPQIFVESFGIIKNEEVEDYLDKAFEKGFEGLMLRNPNELYNFKRSDALLKIKESKSNMSEEIISDCVVKEIIIDSFPIVQELETPIEILDENGEIFVSYSKIVYEEILVALWVEQADGILCKIGSGFDLNFRRYYTTNQDELLYKVVEIKHQGYGIKGRMRFPRLERVRYDLKEDIYGR